MKKWLLVVAVSFGAVGGVYAQESSLLVVARENDSSSAETVQGTSWAMAGSSANTNDYFLAPGLKLSFAEPVAPEFVAARMAAPMASPAQGPKRHSARESDDYRLQIGLGFTYVRFRSAAFDVGLYGLNTSVVYFPSQWLGVEANFTAAFGPHVFNNSIDQTRYAGITGGPKILWRKGGWEPWAHALVGVAHVNPQLGDVSKNGVAIQVGGGNRLSAWAARSTLRGRLVGYPASLVVSRQFPIRHRSRVSLLNSCSSAILAEGRVLFCSLDVLTGIGESFLLGMSVLRGSRWRLRLLLLSSLQPGLSSHRRRDLFPSFFPPGK